MEQKLQSAPANSMDSYGSYQETYVRHEYIPEPEDLTPQIPTPSYLEDKYTFIRQIGHGAQGHVYKAVRKSDNIEVALKELKIDSVTNWKEYELFQRESKVLSSLNMKGVAKFYESMEFLNIPHPAAYIVQEYIHGHSLEDLLKSGYRFSLTKIYEMLIQIINVLEKLHSHEPCVIHRDIKPSNIILCPKSGDDFEIYIIDFGAVANPQIQSGGSTVAGTFGYMPPEQLMGRPVPASDIYSLGALAVHLISGMSPADMQVKDFHLVFEPHMQSMPIQLLSFLGAMLDPNIATRQCDYHYLRKTLQAFMESRYEDCVDSTQREKENLALWMSESYGNEISKVLTLGDAGNLALWQKVPESLPRPIPAPIEKATIQKHKISMKPLLNSRQAVQNIKKNNVVLIILSIVGGFFAISVFVGLLASSIDSFITTLFLLLGIVVGSPLGWIPAIVLFVVLRNKSDNTTSAPKSRGSISSKFGGLGHIFPTPEEMATKQSKSNFLKHLIANSSKTIATIIDISYVPAQANDVEVLTTPPQKPQCTMCAYHGVSAFRIRYKFNPPDDSSPYDLIHEILIHDDPEGVLQVGDPLPILYKIEKTGNYEKVFSTPFPFPLGDIVDFDEIVGRSQTAL